jgi:F0F1-type ATP synthase assembly protein I
MSEMPQTRLRTRRLSLRPVNRLVLGSSRPAGVESGMGQGMELAVTLLVFLGIGWLIDSRVDTRPIFTVALVVFAMVGQSVRMWFEYDARMKVLERERQERLTRPSGTAPVPRSPQGETYARGGEQ